MKDIMFVETPHTFKPAETCSKNRKPPAPLSQKDNHSPGAGPSSAKDVSPATVSFLQEELDMVDFYALQIEDYWLAGCSTTKDAKDLIFHIFWRLTFEGIVLNV